MESPKISIVTAIYNGEQYLEGLLQSIIRQDYTNLELILIDGGSKDDSVKIINQFSQYVSYWISEPDKGIYDAWNKGIEKATGDWIMFLGCDDLLLPGALQRYAQFISSLPNDIEFISSKVQMVDERMKPIRELGWQWEWPRFLKGMTVAHPGALHSKSLFKNYGKYNSSYKIVGDYELLLRPGVELKTAFMASVTVIMREGGASDSWAAIREQCMASIKTGKYLPFPATANMLFLGSKFYTKRLLRRVGINAYLRR